MHYNHLWDLLKHTRLESRHEKFLKAHHSEVQQNLWGHNLQNFNDEKSFELVVPNI